MFSFTFVVMGHILANELQIKDSMDVVRSLAVEYEDSITERERLLVEAAKALSAGWDEAV